MAPTASDELRSRMNQNWPTSARSISTAALAAFDAFGERRATVDTSKADWRDAMRKAAVSHGKSLATAMRDLDHARAKLTADRAALRTRALQHPSPREADIASEIRAHLRGLNQGQATALLLGPTADPGAQRALLEAPRYLVPALSDDFRQRVEVEFLTNLAPDDVASLDATDEALHHAETSINLARGTIQRETAFRHSTEFLVWWEKECSPDPITDHNVQRRQEEADRLAAVDARLAELVAA